MKTKKTKTLHFTLAVTSFAVLLFSGTASADHSWSKFHWNLSQAETLADPLDLGNNLSGGWSAYLTAASLDWNWDPYALANSVLQTEVVDGGSVVCDPTLGSVEVCNDEYGENGWLGIASIWTYRGRDGHIAQGVVKVNDTYFNDVPYNTASWKKFVMCQEVGHTFGLDHQDVNHNNDNLGSCMDYTNDPDGTIYSQQSNEDPNQHDYDQLCEIYEHLNSPCGGGDGDGGGGPGNGNGPGGGGPPGNNGNGNNSGIRADLDHNDPSSWGKAVKQDSRGNNILFELDLGHGLMIITHVIWAD